MANKKRPAAKKPNAAQAGANRRAALQAQLAAQEKRSRRNRLIVVVAIIVVVALVISGLVWLGTRKPVAPPITPPPTGQIDPPNGDARRAWITVPSANTKQGALQVDIHADYQCSYCKVFENTYAKPLEQLSDSGDIVLNFHTRTFVGDQMLHNDSSTRAAIAAACVDVADETKYTAYNNAIFSNQPSEGTGYTDQQLTTDFAADAGLTGNALANFQSCYTTRATAQWVADVESNNWNGVENPSPPFKYLYGSDKTITNSDGTGVQATPTMFVDGKEFTLNDLFDTSWNPIVGTDSASLLTFLQGIATSTDPNR